MTIASLFKRLGPGFITGVSDDDPSAIATYAQSGAQFGLAQLWTAPFVWPLLSAIQEMCGRIGRVTGLGLAGVMRRHYARPIVYVLVGTQVLVNTVTIGADLSGMAQSGQLLWHIPYLVWLAITTCITIPLIVFIPYAIYVAYLRVIGLTLLSYIAAASTLKIDWHALLRATFIPTLRFDKDFLLALVAVLGTTISPFEFFWESSEEVEELVQEHAISHEGERPSEGQLHLAFVRWDTAFGMFVANLVMYFIILASALTLGAHGITTVDTAAQAAQALRPLAGNATFALFTLGIMSAGLISIPVIAASSAYAVTGALDLPGSLAERPSKEPTFYWIIVGTSLAGLLVNALPIPPFRLLFYSAVLSGIISPVMVFMVINLARSSRVMGRHANSPLSNALGWILFAIMTASLATWIVLNLH
ncbi:MAG TPA: Nramp family divalent metal transporter [Candidatus Baltobacteraceae bacterium]|jgi:NRAMP (natural resistance-associated macrophage protein)-like metal ion transporter